MLQRAEQVFGEDAPPWLKKKAGFGNSCISAAGEQAVVNWEDSRV